MAHPRVFIISGPSGVGKSSIIHRFLALRPDVTLSVSTTTRKPREDEQEGREYYFVELPDFERQIGHGKFLEWARSYDHYYGTGTAQIEEILSSGQHALLDIDTQGALQIQEAYQGAVYVFIEPPSLAVLEKRLRGRGSETEESIKKRLARAQQEIDLSSNYDHVIENRVIEDTVRSFIEIIDREKERPVSFQKLEEISPESLRNTAEKATRYALERIDRESLVQSLEGEVKAALRMELEELIKERLERILRNDLGRIVEETYRERMEG